MRTVAFPERFGTSLKVWTSIGDLRVLLWLCSQANGDILEIGCNEGLTLMHLATTFPGRKIYGVDWSRNRLEGALLDEKPAIIGRLARGLPNVTIFDCDSKTLTYPKGLGLIFVDGDHTRAGVEADSIKACNYIGQHHGIVAWHDYGSECYPEVTRYLDELSAGGHDIFHVPGTLFAALKM